MMFWTRLGSSVVLVVLALIFLISGGPVLGAVCLLLSLTAYYELIKACHVEKDGKFTLLEIMGGCGIVLYGAAMMLSKNFLWGIGAIVLMFLAVMFVYVFHFPKYHADQVMTRDSLMELIWGVDFFGESRTLDMHIRTLRKKLGEAGSQIQTIRNVGYCFRKTEDETE